MGTGGDDPGDDHPVEAGVDLGHPVDHQAELIEGVDEGGGVRLDGREVLQPGKWDAHV